jgi:AsmA protein
MRRFLKIILSLLVILIIVAAAVPFLVPADKLKDEILAQIEAHTGRKVSIEHVSFSILPSIALDAEGVTVGNPAWAGGGDMAQIKTLKLGLELLPLLHKEYHLKELTLEQPVLMLVKQHGRANWDFGNTENKETAISPAGQETKSGNTGSPHKSLGDLHLDVIAIKDGSATYKDDASPRAETISDLNFTLKAPDLSQKADISLSMLLNGQKTDIALTLDKPLAFEDGSPTNVDLKASYGPYDFTWIGTAVEKGGIPSLTGKLTIPSLDTTTLPQKDSSGAKEQKSTASASAPKPGNASRWSDAPIRLDGLARANADLQFSIGSLTLPKTTLKDINASLRLQGGNLQLATNPVNAYGGTLQLSLSVNTAGVMNINFTAAKAQAEPLLHDFASYDRVSGVVDLKTALNASGTSQRALINSLAGSGSVAFRDGKLKGVNLAAMLRNPGKGVSGSDEEGTDFSELSGTFTVARGIVTTNDFKMNSPLLRVTGAGTADLPNWQEHFLLKPMLVASLQGQDGKDAAGIVVPVDVEGTLDHPHYQPDLKAALQDNLNTLKDPARLKQGVKNLKENLLNGGGLGNLLR